MGSNRHYKDEVSSLPRESKREQNRQIEDIAKAMQANITSEQKTLLRDVVG